jgi:tRNA pseudouridine55 synthase
MSEDKVYEGSLTLGVTTTTYDAQGQITATQPVPDLTLDQLNPLAQSFVGDQLQRPPMVSAVKQGGVPLYKLARQGLEVERKERLVHIYTFAFSQFVSPTAHFRVACTKGTYVRTLVHDLGQRLACGAHLATLRRLRSGRFDVAQALPLDQALQLPPAALQKHVIPFLQLAGPAA